MSFSIAGLPEWKTHPRSHWEHPDFRVATWVYQGKVYVCPRIDLSTVDGNADHWPGSGAATIDTSTDAKVIDHLRGVQRYYVTGRGYSVGYGIAVDQRGHAWEQRGFDFKSAANASHNGHVIPVYVILGANQVPSAAMIETITLIHAESARRAGRSMAPWSISDGWWISGHNDLRQYPPLAGRGTPTSCCGPAMYALLHQQPVGHGGALRPGTVAPPPPPPSGYNPPENWGLYPLDRSKPVIRHGDRNEHVRYLQDALVLVHGFDIVRDGIYGDQSANAVKFYQGANGINVSGQVWEDTWLPLDQSVRGEEPEPPPPPPPPPPDPVKETTGCFYRLPDPVKWPYAVALDVYGDGNRYPEIQDSKYTKTQVEKHGWKPGTVVWGNGVPGYRTRLLDGEGPASVIRRIYKKPTSYWPSAELRDYYKYNGGEKIANSLRPGQWVWMPR